MHKQIAVKEEGTLAKRAHHNLTAKGSASMEPGIIQL
jgi:hypothetical protein